eukprot:CAMPEP_0170951702 /NCGR_PEP_ID=MMETSP0735-20130129/30835_1 /TAXON_ID=186038 /ORGANISM="Fragilariopsis kerguelensis, Strain L26-C5" /LENGTH=126 /DNA_ID=CAMNT_0011362621 /DNA_START=408 /DNA_END=784 /DNA_ORIENTATION=-
MTPMRKPSVFSNKCCNVLVFPLPKNPLNNVTGIFRPSGSLLFVMATVSFDAVAGVVENNRNDWNRDCDRVVEVVDVAHKTDLDIDVDVDVDVDNNDDDDNVLATNEETNTLLLLRVTTPTTAAAAA